MGKPVQRARINKNKFLFNSHVMITIRRQPSSKLENEKKQVNGQKRENDKDRKGVRDVYDAHGNSAQ